jgi:hypothetical protein
LDKLVMKLTSYMKKTISEKAFLLLFTVFLALIFSCKKDLSTTLEKPGQELSETSVAAIIRAREAFINQSKTNLVQHTGKSLLSDSLLNYRTVLWSDAYTKISGDTVAVFIPIKIPATLTIDEGSLAGTCLNDNLFLRMIDNGDGFKPILTEMVSMIPDDSNGWNIRKEFSGLLLLENWYSPSSSFIQVSQGQKVPPVKKIMSDGGMSTQGWQICQTINVTQCAGIEPYLSCEVVSTTTCMGGETGGGGGGTGGGGEGGQPPIGGGPGGGGGGNTPVTLNTLDTTGLWKYPNFKNLVTNLPTLISDYPNILLALTHYTGFTNQQIRQLIKPGVGPKINVTNLPDKDGRTLFGHYDRDSKILEINLALVNGLDAVNSPDRYKALGLLLTLATLHEFVHYGRDINNMSILVYKDDNKGYEAGWEFEASITPLAPGTTIDRNNAIEWINYYKYNFE